MSFLSHHLHYRNAIYSRTTIIPPAVWKGTDEWYLLQEICLQGPPPPLGTGIPYRELCLYAHTSLGSEDDDTISRQVLQTQQTRNTCGISHRAHLTLAPMKTVRGRPACSPRMAFKDRRRGGD